MQEQSDSQVILGRNPVLQALDSQRELEKLLVQKGALHGSVQVILAKARDRGLVTQFVDKAKLDAIAQENGVGTHQGVALFVSATRYYDLDELVETARTRSENPFLILLDGVTDPYNVGSILRSALCLGAQGVLLPKRRSAGVGAAAAKASAGAVEHLPVARIDSPRSAVQALKKQGFWVVGAHMEGQPAKSIDLSGPVLLVMGGEDKGLSAPMQAACDWVACLPTAGEIGSLNVSVATAIFLYERLRQLEGK